MAIGSMIRRASSTALSLAIRESKTPKSFRFSTCAVVASKKGDEKLARELETVIDGAEDPRDWKCPVGFRFDIDHKLLTSKFEDETIKVEVDMSRACDIHHLYRCPAVVTISKGNGQELLFGITARPGEITINSLSIKYPSIAFPKEMLQGPDFDDLNDNLYKATLMYLEKRGIKPSTTDFMVNYMSKDGRSYLNWLNSLKRFVDK